MLRAIQAFILVIMFVTACEKYEDSESIFKSQGARCIKFANCSSPSVIIIGFAEDFLVTGTGSFVKLNEKSYSILTAAHVVSNKKVTHWFALPTNDPTRGYETTSEWKKKVTEDLESGKLSEYRVESFKYYDNESSVSNAHQDLALLEVPQAYKDSIEGGIVQPHELSFENKAKLVDQHLNQLYTITAGTNSLECDIAGYMCKLEVNGEQAKKTINNQGELSEAQRDVINSDDRFKNFTDNKHRILHIPSDSFLDKSHPNKKDGPKIEMLPGDSGSPLIYEKDGKSYVVGVYHGTWSDEENSSNIREVFTLLGGRQELNSGDALKADMENQYNMKLCSP